MHMQLYGEVSIFPRSEEKEVGTFVMLELIWVQWDEIVQTQVVWGRIHE